MHSFEAMWSIYCFSFKHRAMAPDSSCPSPGEALGEMRAYRHKMRQYHPDRVSALAPEFLELAERRTKALNAAYLQATQAIPAPQRRPQHLMLSEDVQARTPCY
jgi:hypothetical protein